MNRRDNDMNSPIRFQPVFNLFCRDIDAQMAFYAAILGWREVHEAASPIYRAIAQDDTRIAFHGGEAYALLGLSGRETHFGKNREIGSLLTFVIADHESVESIARQVVDLGGVIVKPPFATYYGHWQVVFQDPEGNIARISASSLPAGIAIPELAFEGT